MDLALSNLQGLICHKPNQLTNQNQLTIGIVFVYTQLTVKTVPFQTIQFNVSTVSMSKTVPFQTVQFIIKKKFHFKQFSLA